MVKQGMDAKFPAQSANEGLYHAIAGKHFACKYYEPPAMIIWRY